MNRLITVSFVFAILLLAGSPAEAQFTVTYTDLQGILVNSSRLEHYMEYGPPPTIDLGSPSPTSQTFDFSVLSGETLKVSMSQDFVDPAGQPGASEFPDATMCSPIVIDSLGITFTSAGYFRIQSDGFYNLGTYTLIDFPPPFPPDQVMITKHKPPELLIPLPLAYGTSRTGIDTVVTDSVFNDYTVTTTTIACDGWGDITFPSVLAGGKAPMSVLASCLRATQTAVKEDYSGGSFVGRRKSVSVTYVTADGSLLTVEQPDTGYTGGSASVTAVTYSVKTGSSDVRRVSPSVPDGYSLSQNYPNPFNPATVITFSIPAAGRVSLKVYDLLGREVALLADGWMAPGSYEATFDAGNLPSGMYLCRMVAGSYTETRKMNVVK